LLHSHTDGALSRLKLMQIASLPDADRSGTQAPSPLRLELPLLVGAELAMAQLQIFRDGQRQKSEGKRGWAVRFAVATAATGEVGAEIGLNGKTLSVALWATEPETAEALESSLPELEAALHQIGVHPTVHLRKGPPAAAVTSPGQLVDRGL
jgi:hypothetical protein